MDKERYREFATAVGGVPQEAANPSASAKFFMIKLISLNIERSNHLHRNIPFFQREQADILCLQEVFEADVERLAHDLEMPFFVWLKDTLIDETKSGAGRGGYSGPAIFSRVPFINSGSEYYYMPQNGIVLEGEKDAYPETNAQGIVWVDVDIAGDRYRFANTHFTCTVGGVFDEHQAHDFQELKKILDHLGAHILTGDLNSPRGRGSWEQFVGYYDQDNIPADVTSTIDPELHRVQDLELVVDGIFAKPPFIVGDVSLVAGLSDHKAIVASITKNYQN